MSHSICLSNRGIIFLEETISYADDIDVRHSNYNSKQGCVVWGSHKTFPYYLGLFWKYIKASNNQLVKSTIAYERQYSNKAQFSRIMGYMDAVLSHANDNKYTYTLPTGERFGITIEISDDLRQHSIFIVQLTEYWVNPDVWNQSTQVQSTVMKNDVNVVFTITWSHICVVYQIHYIRRPTPTYGQLGMAVVHNEDTPTRIRVPFINKIASLLSEDNDLYMLTPFTEIDKEFGLNTDRRLHVTGVTTPGNPPIVYISTSLRPLSNQDINVLLYSSLHEFSTQLNCSTSINSSTIAQLVGNAHKSSICMRFSITNESAKHKSQFIELCIQRRIHDKDDAGLLDISCTLSRKIKQVEDSSLARSIPNYIRRLGSATIQLRCNQSLSINSDNYSTTEIYTTESNRLFATVYATYVPGTGISCILVLSSMLNKVENDLTKLSLLRYPKVMARYNYGFEDDCIPIRPIIVNASKKFDLQLVINAAIHKYKDQGCQPPLKSSSTHYWNVRVHKNGLPLQRILQRMHDCTYSILIALKEYLLHQTMLQSHLANLYTLLDIGSKIVTSYAASMQIRNQSSDDATKRDTKRNMARILNPATPAMNAPAEPPLRLGISPGAPPMAHSSSSPFDYPHVPPMQHPMVPAMGAPPPPSMQESSHQPPVLGSIGSQLEPHNTPLSSEQASNWSTLADEEMTETLFSSRTRLGKGKASMSAAEEEQMAAEAGTIWRGKLLIKYINSSWSDVTVILYNKDNEIMEKKETAPIIQDDTAITCSFSTAKDELRRIVTLFGQANKYLLITTFPDGIHSLEDDIISEIIPYTAVARVTRVLPLAKQFNANGDTDRQSILSQIYERKDVPYTCQHALQRDPGQNLVELSYTIRSISMPSWPIEIQGMLGTATTSTNQHGKNTSRSIAIGDSSTSSMGYLTEEAAGTSSSLKKKSSSESLRKRVEKNRKKLIELKDNIKKRFGSESK
ncbi:hypothetical protein BDF22DRAFT_673644 [Syncephalis plumigaleata]|nr:hypothetical protein BDF22DRAFT_673644 [Syncephalis plumigaleata]